MNTCYEIYETMKINKVEHRHDDLISLLQEHVSRIAGYNLLSRAYIFDVRLTSALDVYTCTEDSSMEAWRTLINSIDAAENLTLSIGYSYEDSQLFATENIGPDRICSYLNAQTDEYLNTVFYRTYTWASDSDNSGELAAYGLKAGRLHRGPLTYLGLYRIPDGKWFNQQAAFSFTMHDATMAEISALEPLCQQLMGLSHGDTLDVEGSTITYSMNNAFLDGIESVEKYISCVKSILQITGQEAFDTYFFDSSANNMKLLHITVLRDEEHKLEIAEL